MWLVGTLRPRSQTEKDSKMSDESWRNFQGVIAVKDRVLVCFVLFGPLLDHLKHKGPNGEHGSLVFEVMDPSTSSVVECLPISMVIKTGRRNRYPIWIAKSILRQALFSIGFLHQNGVAHGDLQPSNHLFSVADLTSVAASRLWQQNNDTTSLEPVNWPDGKDSGLLR